ncbi:hypothetical protein PROFUN_09195 [Planoprotostelium fungivorum]|uniref:Uncharacterized protein n=1 Tax=Planoprotostelium fungivorum TaxID=1890364 RepID=A0A2P6N2U9_9EUKA|nr:hypothetical protein PROFUN_13902 [Planoprotostelium fungivorum]PRP83422.1 hypothetical protein PROFUN_09195 [Planoprotostelium fungivorum]
MRDVQDPRQPLLDGASSHASIYPILCWTFDADSWPTFREEIWDRVNAVQRLSYPIWTIMCIFSGGLCFPCIYSQYSTVRRPFKDKYGRYNPAVHRCSLEIGSVTVFGDTYLLQPSEASLARRTYNLQEVRLDSRRYPNGVQIVVLSLILVHLSSETDTATDTIEDVVRSTTLEIPVPHDQVKVVVEALPEFCKGLTQHVSINLPV